MIQRQLKGWTTVPLMTSVIGCALEPLLIKMPTPLQPLSFVLVIQGHPVAAVETDEHLVSNIGIVLKPGFITPIRRKKGEDERNESPSASSAKEITTCRTAGPTRSFHSETG